MSNLEKISEQLEKIEDSLQIIISLLIEANDISSEEFEDIIAQIYAAKIKIASGDIKENDKMSKKIDDVLKKLD